MPLVFRQLALLLLFVPGLCLGADVSVGKELYAPCVACHGAAGEGNPMVKSPAIAGQSESYLSRQLMNFRTGVRGAHSDDKYGKQMAMMSKLVSAEELNDIVAFVNEIAQQR